MRPVALITGSATGVGRACAQRFARKGYDVIVNYSRSETEARETCQLVETESARALLIACDISDDAAVRAMLQQVESEFGRLNVLVNNAGWTQYIEMSKLEDLTEDIWDRVLAINLKGPFFVTRAAAKLLRASRGAVVNVSSVAGIAGSGSSIAYAASKGALNTMTKSLARVFAPEVRVNAICPGPIDSRWMRDWMSEEQIEKMVSTYPIPRASSPDDITDAIEYLACGNSMMTGQCIVMDGGRTM